MCDVLCLALDENFKCAVEPAGSRAEEVEGVAPPAGKPGLGTILFVAIEELLIP